MTSKALTLNEIYDLAKTCLMKFGLDSTNAVPLANTIMAAERDGSHSHGLFRLPAYLSSLKSGKVNRQARPKLSRQTHSFLSLHADNGFAPLAHSIGIPALVEVTKEEGIGVLGITHVHHMAALWPEVEALASENLAGLACTPYMPAVAPAGASKALFGTNPISFAWPRPGKNPVVFDMATAAMAMGEVQIAARENLSVPYGTGLDRKGKDTKDPKKILDGGVLLPFGGYKGSAIAMMVELLAAGLINERFSFEAKEKDNGDGGPPQGGQFIMALSPEKLAKQGWGSHCEAFFERMENMEGLRMPGARRHKNRLSQAPRQINAELLDKIHALTN